MCSRQYSWHITHTNKVSSLSFLCVCTFAYMPPDESEQGAHNIEAATIEWTCDCSSAFSHSNEPSCRTQLESHGLTHAANSLFVAVILGNLVSHYSARTYLPPWTPRKSIIIIGMCFTVVITVIYLGISHRFSTQPNRFSTLAVYLLCTLA